MTTISQDLSPQLKSPRPPLSEYQHPTTRIELGLEKHSNLNLTIEQDGLDQELLKKKNQSKQRYRRLKQKLNTLCCDHQQICLIKINKQISSPNKSRLLTLSIEFEKLTLNQTKDYPLIQSKLKEIQKILDFKKQHDLFILKQSRFIPAFSALLKKVPTFHKNQLLLWVKTLEIGLKVIRIFCTLSSNRDYMIFTNQLSTLNSCLSSFIGNKQKKLSLDCLSVLLEILSSKIKADLQQIVNITLQIVFFGQLAKRLRQGIQTCLTDDSTNDEQYIFKSLKYLHILYRKSFDKFLQRPLYQQPQLPQLMQSHLDGLLIQLEIMLPIILLDKEQANLRDDDPPNCIINISLYILKLLNLCFHVSFKSCQKILQISSKSQFWLAISCLFEYCGKNIQESADTHEIGCIYTEIVDLLGKTCCESPENRKSLHSTKLLEQLYNHPIVYFMDPKLKQHLIPSLCSVMTESQLNMKKYLQDNSADNLIHYIQAHKNKYLELQKIKMSQDQVKEIEIVQDQDFQYENQETLPNKPLKRKQSVSSLNSYTTQCTQNSCIPLLEQEKDYSNFFFLVPFVTWETLMNQLKTLDG